MLDLTWGLRSLSGEWPSSQQPGHWIACLLMFRIRLTAAMEIAGAERAASGNDRERTAEHAMPAAGPVPS